ncbi:alpha/beta hydrolase [Pseudofrankia asymbiotica]|uniref:Alpha/beta hydrolase n=1 Tax=Pseudofrankia asymbiotica TaxID=1834516 RepID=A0A1V2IFA1_9ACTN|nr:alpha/beta hydrolase [Pseudofrankia asymbiotica]ONH31690.1 alpha/beta hydrolase [Pseudofrankia asymbiotica]
MSEIAATKRPAEPDWLAMTAEELVAYRDAENLFRASPAVRPITGDPDPGAAIGWQELALPGRGLPVRVYRPSARADEGARLPFVLHVHGGGFVGTAVQNDWVNSHLAAQLPAVVVSVEHRLLDYRTALPAAVADGWDVLQQVMRDAEQWGVDPARTAVFGESCGALISAMAAIRARESRQHLRAQVLVNPAVDMTDTMLQYASVTQYPHTPTLAVPVLRLFKRLAVTPGTDPRALSPLYADSLDGLAPALVVVPTHDPLADQGRQYAERLRAAGTSARLSEYPGAGHAFLSVPGMAPQAEAARAEIREFLRASLAG